MTIEYHSPSRRTTASRLSQNDRVKKKYLKRSGSRKETSAGAKAPVDHSFKPREKEHKPLIKGQKMLSFIRKKPKDENN